MTVFGKILVFLNLLFSVVTGALIVFVFTTRSNWVAAYNDAKAKAESAEVAFRQEKASHDNDRKQAEQTQASFNEELKKRDDQIKIAQEEAQRAGERALTQTNLNNTSSTTAQRLQAELDQNRSERDALVAEKESLRQRIIAIQKELDGWRTTAITSDLEAKNMRQRVTNLLRQVEELTARTRELEASAPGGTSPGRGATSAVDQPTTAAPPGVKGHVTGVGSNFVQVDIGSDSGLSAGNVLIVFSGSEYLGDLTVTVAEPKTAVGKFVPKSRSAKVKKGDSVITSFTGSPQ
jgi:cell shape-determining protein MreC